jgi:hypothetical protein
MKRKITFVLLLLCSNWNILYSQIPKPNEHVKRVNNKRFIGVWKFQDESQSLVIWLKEESVSFGTSVSDMIIGVHEYKVKNEIKQTSKLYFNNKYADKKNTIGGSTVINNPNLFQGTVTDISKEKLGRLRLTLSPDGKTMQWDLTNLEQHTINGERLDDTFTLPKQVKLVKQ